MTQLQAFDISVLDARTASSLGAFNRIMIDDIAIMIFIDESSVYDDEELFTLDYRSYLSAIVQLTRPLSQLLLSGIVHLAQPDGNWLRIQPTTRNVLSPLGVAGLIVRLQTERPPTVQDMRDVFSSITTRFRASDIAEIDVVALVDTSGSMDRNTIGARLNQFVAETAAIYGDRLRWHESAFGTERWLQAAEVLLRRFG